MSHPAQLLSDPRRPYVPQGTNTDPAPTSDSLTSSPAPLPTSPSLLPFDPPAHLIPKIIRELADPTLSLAMTARTYSTDLDALCIWISRPDIAQRIFITESAFAVKTRLAASSNMAMVAQTCQAIIHEFHDDQHHMNFKPQDPKGHEVKRRNRETSMRAGRLLLRLSKYVPMSPANVARATAGTPTPRGGSSSPSPESNGSDSGSPKSAIRNPKSEIALLALLNNPKLATQLANAIAAQLSQPAASAVNSTDPPNHADAPATAGAPVSSSEIPNPQSEVPPAPTPQSESYISPAKQPKQPHSPTPRSVQVPLTISAHPILAAAGSPPARAP